MIDNKFRNALFGVRLDIRPASPTAIVGAITAPNFEPPRVIWRDVTTTALIATIATGVESTSTHVHAVGEPGTPVFTAGGRGLVVRFTMIQMTQAVALLCPIVIATPNRK